jgi:hypothetical protein
MKSIIGDALAISCFVISICTTHASEFSLEHLEASCIEFQDITVGPDDKDTARDCAVSEFGEIGTVGDKTYYYAIYCLIPGYSEDEACASDSFSARYHKARGLAIFLSEDSPDHAELWMERATPEIGILLYEEPVILRNSHGTILHVPIALDGTGHGNESEYYTFQDETKEWRKLETEAWLSGLTGWIPDGLAINKGIWPNLETLTATAPLYRGSDPNCCPSGGEMNVQLEITGGRLSIKSVTVDLPNDDGEER